LELLRDSIVEFIARSAGGGDSPANAKQDENIPSWPSAAAA